MCSTDTLNFLVLVEQKNIEEFFHIVHLKIKILLRALASLMLIWQTVNLHHNLSSICSVSHRYN